MNKKLESEALHIWAKMRFGDEIVPIFEETLKIVQSCHANLDAMAPLLVGVSNLDTTMATADVAYQMFKFERELRSL